MSADTSLGNSPKIAIVGAGALGDVVVLGGHDHLGRFLGHLADGGVDALVQQLAGVRALRPDDRHRYDQCLLHLGDVQVMIRQGVEENAFHALA